MSQQKPGIRVGNYRITPLGIALMVVVVLVICGVILYFSGVFTPDTQSTPNIAADPSSAPVSVPPMELATNSPTPEPIEETPEPEPTPTPEPTPVPGPATATIRFLGEISADDDVLAAALQADGSYDFTDMFSMISGAVGKADYTVADIEGAVGGIGNGYKGKSDYNTPESILTNLSEIGVDMLAMANDHALDTMFNGLENGIANCQAAGLDYVGAAASQEEHDTPKIVDVNGINVCFLNYTTTLNSKEKATDKAAVEYGVNLAKYANSKDDVDKAKAAGADVIIAIVSWGDDGSRKITSTQKKVAQLLVESGVDVIVGYGPRNAQAVTWLEVGKGENQQRTLCAISVGTFLSDSTKQGLDYGTIFEITITEQDDGTFAVENPTSIPTYVWRYQDGEKDAIRVLACGEWLEEKPSGMSDEDYDRLKKIWNDIPSLVTETSTVAVN